MAWHDGYPLSQTLFTSLHLTSITPQEFKPLDQVVFRPRQKREPNPLISDVLRAWCIGLLKSCDSVITDIVSEHYYEEEDFVTQTFTQYLLSDIDDASIIYVLDSAQKTLDTLDLSDELKEAFSARLELRTLLLQAFQPLSAAYHASKTELWQAVQSCIAKVDASIPLSKPVPSAFSERIQRHLASNAPPRPMISITWPQAHPKLLKLCSDNLEAYRICSLLPTPSPANIFRFVSDFAARSPQPGTYSRSILQGILFKTSHFAATIPHADLLLNDIRELVLAGDPLLNPTNWEIEVPSDARHQIARKIDDFLGKAIEEYLNLPRMLCQNRCRVRRTLNQSIAILDALQAEAELVDSSIHEILASTSTASPTTLAATQTFKDSVEPLQYFPLAAWSYHHKLNMAELTILLGFETEVFLPDENAPMYAFLANLAQTREEHLEHIDFFAHRRAQRMARLADANTVSEIVASRALIKVLVAKARAVRYLSEALKGLWTFLVVAGLVVVPPRPYSSADLRHEVRMRPFLQIGTPVIPSRQQLDAATGLRKTRSLGSVFATVETGLKQAKVELATLKGVKASVGRFEGCEVQWAEEIRGLLGSCVGVGLAVAVLKASCAAVGVVDVGDLDKKSEKGGTTKREEVKKAVKVEIPEIEKRWRAGWVVPKISEIKKL